MPTTIASASVRIGPDLSGFRAELEAEVESALASARANVRVGADTTEAQGQLSLFEAQVKAVDGNDVKVNVDADTAAAETKLGAVHAQADALDGKSVNVRVKVDSSDAERKVAETEQGFGALVTVATTLGPALIPVTAAAVGFGVAAVSAFGAAALGAGVVALVYKQIKAQVEDELTPAIHVLQTTAAAGLGPGIQADVRSLLTDLPQVRGLVASVSGELGTLARDAGRSLEGPGFRSFFTYIDTSAQPILDQLGHTLGNLVEAGAHLVVAFAPVTSQIGAGLEHLTAGLASSTEHSQGLQHFVAYVATEGPVVVHTLEATASAAGHIAVSLEGVGGTALALIKGFDTIIQHTPQPIIEALVVSFGAYTVAAKLAGFATKNLAVDIEAAEAAAGPVAIAIAAATIAFTSFISAKQSDAEATKEVVQSASDYVAGLNTVYTSQQSVADSTEKIRQRQQELADTIGGKTVFATAKQAAEIKALGEQIPILNQRSQQATANARQLAQQYGLTTDQVVRLSGGSQHLIGSFSTVNARFHALYVAARETHNPLSIVAKDEEVLGDKAATAAQQVTAFADILNVMAGNALNTDAAALTFKDDIAQLEGALKASHGSLNANTTAGLASAEALNAAAQQALAVANATEKQTGSAAKARHVLQAEIDVLKQTAGHSKAARDQIDLLEGALAKIPDTANHANEGFQANAGQIAKNAKQAAGQATAAVQSQKPNATNAGASFAQGYADGISGGTSAVVNAAVSLATQAVQAVQNTQKSKSPSQVMAGEGHNASTGYALGIIAGTPEATKASSSMASKAVTAAAAESKKQAAAAKAFAQSLATYIAETDQYITTSLRSDLAGNPNAIRSGVKGIEYRLQTGDRHNFISTPERKQLDDAIDTTGSKLIQVAKASDLVTKQLSAATSALSNLRSAAQQVASSTASGITNLGDPSQFASVTSGAGILQVEGRQVAVAKQFARVLAELRARRLNKRVYDEIATEGPADLQFAAQLAGLTPQQFAQFNAGESTLGSIGKSAGTSSASYLFGRAIHEQQQVVKELQRDRAQLHQDTHQLIRRLDHLLKNGLNDKGTHGLLKQLDKDTRKVGNDVSKAMNNVASSRKQTRRALVAGARG